MLKWLTGMLGNDSKKTAGDVSPREMEKAAAVAAEECKNEGNVFFAERKFEEALNCYLRALEMAPEYGDAQWNLAITSFFLGDYMRGFEYFESRFFAGNKAHAAHLQAVMRMMSGKRRWQGEALCGERLLIWTEQGFGDSLMFLRYLPMLVQRGNCRLLVACEAELVRIMNSVPGIDAVISKDQPLPSDSFNLHCSLLSLPHIFGTSTDNLPDTVPYLSTPSSMRQAWRRRLAALDGLKVGLVWAGGSQLPEDAVRSLALAEFAPLIGLPRVSLVSLQKGLPAGQLAASNWPIVDWTEECSDFLDTAALIDELDLVVSADTAVAHLAGALGKPVWLLNRFESEWRWMLGREDSPWYPSMRIFTQPALGDWGAVIARVAGELARVSRF